MFGSSVDRKRVDRKSFLATASKTVEITVLSSNYHMEVNPSDLGHYDRTVVTEIIKDIAAGQSLTTNGEKTFKLLVLSEADLLSKPAQQGLRRTMEKFASTCRLILVCESLSKVIEPVRSRCLAIRVPSPTEDEVKLCVERVLAVESPKYSPQFLAELVSNSKRNLRRALLLAECSHVTTERNQPLTQVQLPDWERYIEGIAKEITKTQTPQVLLETRAKLYELIANCIPPEVIFKSLCDELVKRVDNDLKLQIVHWAAFYQSRLASQGQKSIAHIEAFVAKFLCLYKEYLVSMFA